MKNRLDIHFPEITKVTTFYGMDGANEVIYYFRNEKQKSHWRVYGFIDDNYKSSEK